MPLSLSTAKVVPIRAGIFPPVTHRRPRRAQGNSHGAVPIDRGPASTAATIVTHGPALLRHARRLMPAGNDAQDLVQDTVERAMRAVHQLRPGSNLRAWLYAIMVRRALDHYRGVRLCTGQRRELGAPPAPEIEPVDEAPWSRVTRLQFSKAVSQLSPGLRQVFELHEMHCLPYHDVAARLGIPMTTVGPRLRRAREKLRRLVAKLEPAASLS
jgi:RNA polymerase sigma-70 factor (ECF subfamily)